jgi:predicted DNA-binding transcriptional regulator AlpA
MQQTQQVTAPQQHVPPTAPLFMTAAEVARALRVGRRTLDGLVASGAVPPPVKLSMKTVRWSRAAIEALAGGAL